MGSLAIGILLGHRKTARVPAGGCPWCGGKLIETTAYASPAAEALHCGPSACQHPRLVARELADGSFIWVDADA